MFTSPGTYLGRKRSGVVSDGIWDAVGDIVYGAGDDAAAKLSGNTSTTLYVLTQTGDGAASAAPVWLATTGTGDVVRASGPTLSAPILGTPASAVLTNCTGLPQAGTVGLTTADSPQFAALNIGHASDTTLSRGSAGVLQVEGQTIYSNGGALGTPASGNLANCTGLPAAVPTGAILMWSTPTAPTGWLLCDGSAVSRTTYSGLFDLIVPNKNAFTVTIASPAVATMTAHGMLTGDSVYLTTDGALPTGLVANTLYYIIKIDANSYNFATSRANADAGTNINTSGSQSGTHYLRYCPFGLGDGSTTFNVPNLGSNFPIGFNSGVTAYNNVGETGGAATVALSTAELPSHTHPPLAGNSFLVGQLSGPTDAIDGTNTNEARDSTTGATGSGTAHQNLPPYLVLPFIIKT